jgi:hypothetical protein
MTGDWDTHGLDDSQPLEGQKEGQKDGQPATGGVVEVSDLADLLEVPPVVPAEVANPEGGMRPVVPAEVGQPVGAWGPGWTSGGGGGGTWDQGTDVDAWDQGTGLVEGVGLGAKPYLDRATAQNPLAHGLLEGDNQARLADLAATAGVDPAQAAVKARDWAVEAGKDAIAYDDWVAGNTVDAVLKTLLDDRAVAMAHAEVDFAGRLWNDPAAAALEVRDNIVDAKPFDAAWQAGDWGQVAGRVLFPDAAVDAYAKGHPVEAMARWALPAEVVDDALAGQYGRAVGRVVPDAVFTAATLGLGGPATTAAKAAPVADDAIKVASSLADDAARLMPRAAEEVPAVARAADEVPLPAKVADELPPPAQVLKQPPPAEQPLTMPNLTQPAPPPADDLLTMPNLTRSAPPPADDLLTMPNLTRPAPPPVEDGLTMPNLTRRVTFPGPREPVGVEVTRPAGPH